MRDTAHTLAIPLTVAGGVIFVIGAIADSNPVYGVALLTFAAGLACFLTFPLPPHARWPALAQGGLVLAIAASVVDGLLDLADSVGTATSIATALAVVGAVAAFLGRTTGPAGHADR